MWKYLLFYVPLFAVQIDIGGHSLEVEIADTIEAQSTGLSGRAELAEGSGMLFVYQHPHRLSFWMKDTLIPLSIGFFDVNRKLIQIEEMSPPLQAARELPRYVAKQPALYALEVPRGWFDRHRVQLGTHFNFTIK